MTVGDDSRQASTLWTLEGAVAGAAVTAAFWSWRGVAAIVVGAALGAVLGRAVGAGKVQKAWAGAVGAFLIPAVAIALANIVVLFVLAGSGH